MERAQITIGELAKRSGVAASALRFYEERGLIAGTRSAGGRRVFARGTLRRVAFIRIAQTVGLTLGEIQSALANLPDKRTPTKADWECVARDWLPVLERRIETIHLMITRLSSCIGCGCLSMKTCSLYNPGDAAGVRGSGPRYLLGDNSQEILKMISKRGDDAGTAGGAGSSKASRSTSRRRRRGRDS